MASTLILRLDSIAVPKRQQLLPVLHVRVYDDFILFLGENIYMSSKFDNSDVLHVSSILYPCNNIRNIRFGDRKHLSCTAVRAVDPSMCSGDCSLTLSARAGRPSPRFPMPKAKNRTLI